MKRTFYEDVGVIVDALTPSTGGAETFWTQGAKLYLAGVIAHQLSTPTSGSTSVTETKAGPAVKARP